MKGPPLGPGGEDITWPDQVAPQGRMASSTRTIKPQTSNLKRWRSPRRRRLCSHLAYMWATSASTPRSEAVGIPEAAGVT